MHEPPYDDLNQLTGVVEKDSSGNVTGSWAYTYDLGGNILTQSDGTTSHTYTYGDTQWADLLTAFDGQAITYDASGNPTSYYSGSRYAFTWEEGRRLVSTVKGDSTYSYTYDSNGIRTSKTVDGVTHNYLYASGKLLRETYGNVTLEFLYGNGGSPYALLYTNGAAAQEIYYYITNLQGDVLGLIDASGNTVASYTYDPYGKVLTTTGTMAETNPLRYRGYYFDSETELYYLQSRYYDPTTCRFVSADSFVFADQDILGNNTFAYCCNNPISRIDETGHWFDVLWDVVSLVVSVVEVIQNPTDVGAWVGLAMDAVDVLVPCVSGLGEATDAVNATRKTVDAVDDLHDVGKAADAAKSVHGNSLEYPGTNSGYILSDKTTGEVVKFGESINPAHRYTQKFLNGENPINAPLDMTVVVSGTKRDIHIWQHEQIADFYETVGELPKLNKSKW